MVRVRVKVKVRVRVKVGVRVRVRVRVSSWWEVESTTACPCSARLLHAHPTAARGQACCQKAAPTPPQQPSRHYPALGAPASPNQQSRICCVALHSTARASTSVCLSGCLSAALHALRRVWRLWSGSGTIGSVCRRRSCLCSISSVGCSAASTAARAAFEAQRRTSASAEVGVAASRAARRGGGQSMLWWDQGSKNAPSGSVVRPSRRLCAQSSVVRADL